MSNERRRQALETALKANRKIKVHCRTCDATHDAIVVRIDERHSGLTAFLDVLLRPVLPDPNFDGTDALVCCPDQIEALELEPEAAPDPRDEVVRQLRQAHQVLKMAEEQERIAIVATAEAREIFERLKHQHIAAVLETVEEET